MTPRPIGLGYQQRRMLQLVGRRPRLVRELARLMGLPPSAIRQVAGSLAGRGLLVTDGAHLTLAACS